MAFKSEKQRKWMHANKPEMARKWEAEVKAQIGGYLEGNSHEAGGIPIEAEGGEFITSVEATEILGADKLDAANDNPEDYEIIHKNELAARGGLVERDSVNASTLDMLEYINKHGDLPMSDARKRRK